MEEDVSKTICERMVAVPMNFLVTGGAGFIGSNITDRLLTNGHRVVVLDNLSRPNVYKNLMWLVGKHKRLRFFQSSVSNYDKVRQIVHDYDIDFIYHFAGQVGVRQSIEDPWGDFQDNAIGTFNILEAARSSVKKPHVLFASTNKVYGDFETDRPISEAQPVSFCTPYGCSKGAAEQYCLDYYKIYGLPTTVFRMSCIYGNRQMGMEDQGWLAHFMIQKQKEQPVTIYGDGSQVRDALYIDDYVNLCMMIPGNDKVKGEVFNIGGGDNNKISVLDAVKRVGNEYSFAGWRPADQKYYVSDITKVKNVLGWEPTIGIDDGLERLKLWVKSAF